MTKLDNQNKKIIDGVAALPLVIGLVALMVSLGLAISTIGFNEIDNSFVLSSSSRALSHADSGVRDALKRIVHNKNYTDTSGYDIDFSGDATPSVCETASDGCATVKVYIQQDGSATLSPSLIYSEGRYKDSIRKLYVAAVTAVDNTGRILTLFWNEIQGDPLVFSVQATDITTSAATLRGWIDLNSASGINVTFRYDYDPVVQICDDSFGDETASSAPSGTGPQAFSQSIGSLTNNKIYYYCAIAEDGSGNKFFSRVYSFKTL